MTTGTERTPAASEVKKGAALVLIALVLWVLSQGGDNAFTNLLHGAAVLFGIGGLIVAAVGLLRD